MTWYQKRFVYAPKPALHYLDLTPERTTLPGGEQVGAPDVRLLHPKKCFWAEDLYTTIILGSANDEIEHFLFGTIDNDGANAVRASAR
jgi:hypothetical protein